MKYIARPVEIEQIEKDFEWWYRKQCSENKVTSHTAVMQWFRKPIKYLIAKNHQELQKAQTEKEEAVKQAVEAKWNQLQRHTIKEKCESMTDWIDWDDVCKVFGKETALEERIREKKAELEALTNKQNV